MSFPITPTSSNRVASTNNSAADFSKLAVDPKNFATRKPVLKAPKSPAPALTAPGQTRIALNPDQVKAFTTSYLPVAQNIVDSKYANFIKSTPKLQLKFLTPEQLKAANNENNDSVFAYVDSTAPTTINVAYKSPIFKNPKVDESVLKTLIVHEVLHTRSSAFAINMAQTYGKPLADGKPASFSDGSAVRGLTEGLTEILTMVALKIKFSYSSYQRETKWAGRLIEKVGLKTVLEAYFGNNAASMAQVKRAINELVAADKLSPESPAARLTSPRQVVRLPAAATSRDA